MKYLVYMTKVLFKQDLLVKIIIKEIQEDMISIFIRDVPYQVFSLGPGVEKTFSYPF